MRVEQKVDVLAVMDAERKQLAFNLMSRGHSMCPLIAHDNARTAVAELIEASSRVIRAFEAYGNASGLVAEARCRSECESAMVAQKDALARIGGAA